MPKTESASSCYIGAGSFTSATCASGDTYCQVSFKN